MALTRVHGSAPNRRCSFIAHGFQVIDAKEDLQAARKLSSALSTFGGDNQGGDIRGLGVS
ncbi:hypothetical protein KDH83_08170 [Achromobacter sp. Marseille-Q0513]|uniref:hypothetical protein n=1 Tax=Achromobacter sp. Marseille-Q0513 TaxID=2829161 RepID=UPI001BA0B231|nr:hypothetical protein [Achromobacter sp. Marseille-Q0513]MBR8653283.1 hypothetical protein [Achromobacter sp. Marseille-Q0513]